MDNPASAPDLKITIDVHEEGRLIAYVNGHEVDIYANEDGLQVTLARGGIIQTAAELDWNEPHINEDGSRVNDQPDPKMSDAQLQSLVDSDQGSGPTWDGYSDEAHPGHPGPDMA